MSSVLFTSNRAAVLAAVSDAKYRALEIMGGTCENYAAEAAPWRTGYLSGSYTHRPPDGDSVTIGTSVKYAPYQEFGTRKMKGKRHLRPAVEEHISEYKHIAETEFAKIK
jgi:HK97 gp10 family phage protein